MLLPQSHRTLSPLKAVITQLVPLLILLQIPSREDSGDKDWEACQSAEKGLPVLIKFLGMMEGGKERREQWAHLEWSRQTRIELRGVGKVAGSCPLGVDLDKWGFSIPLKIILRAVCSAYPGRKAGEVVLQVVLPRSWFLAVTRSCSAWLSWSLDYFPRSVI